MIFLDGHCHLTGSHQLVPLGLQARCIFEVLGDDLFQTCTKSDGAKGDQTLLTFQETNETKWIFDELARGHQLSRASHVALDVLVQVILLAVLGITFTIEHR